MQIVARRGPVLRSGDTVADIVADVVAATRRETAIYTVNRFSAPWGLGLRPDKATTFHVVTAGGCWLVTDGDTPTYLARGDVVLVSAGIGHALMDTPGRAVSPLAELAAAPLVDAFPTRVVIDGDGPITGLLCGGYLLDQGTRHPLTAMLPGILHIPAGQPRDTGLSGVVELLTAEVDRADPGGPAVITSLVDLLFIYLLRAWVSAQARTDDGWARAIHDPTVGRALALIHAEPGRPWTVASLARAVGVPRATFTRRFTALTGHAPMAYITAWRMTVAARLLREHRAPLRDVARQIGYDSEFAFARAFKRAIGEAPGRYRSSTGPPPTG
jgi:AraC-like DNA-binding protein